MDDYASIRKQISELSTNVRALREDLSALFEALLGPPPKRNPKKTLPEEIRLALMRKSAAHARAQKRIGQGRGAVRTKATKRRLERDSQ